MPKKYSFDTSVKVALYRATAESGSPPSLEAVAEKVRVTLAAIKEAHARLRASRLLLLEPDGVTTLTKFSGAKMFSVRARSNGWRFARSWQQAHARGHFEVAHRLRGRAEGRDQTRRSLAVIGYLLIVNWAESRVRPN